MIIFKLRRRVGIGMEWGKAKEYSLIPNLSHCKHQFMHIHKGLSEGFRGLSYTKNFRTLKFQPTNNPCFFKLVGFLIIFKQSTFSSHQTLDLRSLVRVHKSFGVHINVLPLFPTKYHTYYFKMSPVMCPILFLANDSTPSNPPKFILLDMFHFFFSFLFSSTY